MRVERDPITAKSIDWPKQAPMLQYLEIDQEVAAAEFGDEMQIMSMGEYMASLKPIGAFSMQACLISIMERYGLRAALPLALFSPPSWKKKGEVVGAFGSTPYVGLMVGNMVSTLGLITVSVVAQRQNIDARELARTKLSSAIMASAAAAAKNNSDGTAAAVAVVDAVASVAEKENESLTTAPDQQQPTTETKTKTTPPLTALQLMVLGSNPKSDNGLSTRLVNPLTFPEDLFTVAGITSTPTTPEDEQTPYAPEPSMIHPLFPDLGNGNGGLKMLFSERQAKINAVIAATFNKLAANALLGLAVSPSEPKEMFTVCLPSSTATPSTTTVQVSSVEDFITALEATGHTVIVKLSSAVTSFSMGLSVKEGEKWIQIPLCYPLSTGLYAHNAHGHEEDVVTLMQHAGLSVAISGPLIPQANLEWCLNVSGSTGWIGSQEVNRSWAGGGSARLHHCENALALPAGRRTALRLSTTSAAVLNVTASEGGLLFGGYGALGVCIDSVAAIQQVLEGKCSLYPLSLGGDAKMALLQCYTSIRRQAAKRSGNAKWEYDAEAAKLAAAITALPCDGIVAPENAAATARRALACLPSRTVFAAVKRCRKSLEAAIATAEGILGPSS